MNNKKIIFFILILYSICSSISHAKSSFGLSICDNSSVYDCYKVKKRDTWAKLFPDEETRELAKRINRMNTPLRAGMTIAIPENINNINSLDYAPFNTQIDPPGKKVIVVNFTKLAFGAYDEDGNLLHWGPISGGKGYCPDIGRRCNSPRGTFYIYTKQGGGCVSTKFPVGRGGAPMPYCMFFHGGFALHGSPEVPGYNASHGCIRMFTSDAKWLNQEFTDGERRVAVIVK
jgi:L,D-transpeptidase ErfK/SrfK